MPLVLEMPATEQFDSLPGQMSLIDDADTAADLIDQGEAEAEPSVGSSGDPHGNTDQAPGDPPFDTNNPTGGTPLSVPAGSLESPPPKQPSLDDIAARKTMAALPKEPGESQRRWQIAALENEYIEIALEMAATETEIERHKDRLKILKEQFTMASAELVAARTKHEYQPRLVMGDAKANGERPAGQGSEFAPSSDSPAIQQPAAASPENDAWKSAPLADLGLPPKLAEKLTDAEIATIGDLECWRAEISQGHATWPKGIGSAKITIIEDAVVKWLTKNRDAAVFDQVDAGKAGTQPAETQAVVEPPSAESQDAPPAASSDKPKRGRKKKAAESASDQPKPAGNASPHTSSQISTTAPEPTDAEWAAAIAARVTAINTGKPGCLDQKFPKGSRYWESGYEAYGRGLEIHECPIVPGDAQDDWLRGFLGAKAVVGMPDAATAQPAAAASPAPAISYGSDLDEI